MVFFKDFKFHRYFDAQALINVIFRSQMTKMYYKNGTCIKLEKINVCRYSA